MQPESRADEPREVPVPAAEPEEDDRKGAWKGDLKWATSLLLVAILGLSGWNNSLWQETPRGREDLTQLVTLILGEDQLVFVLQLVGVLLVAALIAAVVLAIRDPEPGEEVH